MTGRSLQIAVLSFRTIPDFGVPGCLASTAIPRPWKRLLKPGAYFSCELLPIVASLACLRLHRPLEVAHRLLGTQSFPASFLITVCVRNRGGKDE